MQGPASPWLLCGWPSTDYCYSQLPACFKACLSFCCSAETWNLTLLPGPTRTQGTRGTRLHKAVFARLKLSVHQGWSGSGGSSRGWDCLPPCFALFLLSPTGRGQRTRRQSDRTTGSEPFMTKVCPGHQWSVLCGLDSNSQAGETSFHKHFGAWPPHGPPGKN